MNRHDVEDMYNALYRRTEVPYLRAAAITLYRLMRWTDSVSDGWPYWSLPSKASAKLQTALKERTDLNHHGVPRRDLVDLTPAEFRALLSPVKAFLTRQKAEPGMDHDEVIWTPERDARQATYAEITVRVYLPLDVTKVETAIQNAIVEGCNSLAGVMGVQAEDGVWLLGSPEAESGEIDGQQVENRLVADIVRFETSVAFGTYEVPREEAKGA